MGCCGDGSDNSIASPKMTNDAVMKGIGRFEAIKPMSIQSTLTSADQPEAFNFSRL